MADWSVFVADREEYSRYEHHDGRSLIRVTLTPQGWTPAEGEGVTVRLMRLDGYGKVGETTHTYGTSETTVTVTLNLEDCKDDDGFYCARAGRYQLEADRLDSQGEVVSTEAGPELWVSIITAERFKARWLYGMPLYATGLLHPLRPTTISGVQVRRVSSAHPAGVFTLAYTVGPPATLKWGQNATAVNAADGVLILPLGDTGGRDYIEVQVQSHNLPAQNETDDLPIDYTQMEDWMLRDFIREGISWAIAQTHIIPEPTLYASPLLADRAQHWYDVVGQPVAYYRPGNFNRWLAIKMPYHYLLRVDDLAGYMNVSRAVEIPEGWITKQERTSLIELVPRVGAVVSWNFYGTAFTLWSARPHIPQFWQYRALFGLRDLEDERAEFVALAGARAGLNTAPKLGEGFTGGRTSYSVGRDGLSESRSYAPGVWATRIEQWTKDTDPKAVRQLRHRLVGMPMTVLV